MCRMQSFERPDDPLDVFSRLDHTDKQGERRIQSVLLDDRIVLDRVPNGRAPPVDRGANKPDFSFIYREEIDQFSLRKKRRDNDRSGLVDRPSDVRVAPEHLPFEKLRMSHIREVVHRKDPREASEGREERFCTVEHVEFSKKYSYRRSAKPVPVEPLYRTWNPRDGNSHVFPAERVYPCSIDAE